MRHTPQFSWPCPSALRPGGRNHACLAPASCASQRSRDSRYNDLFDNGQDQLDTPGALLPYRCVVVYRYYDEASEVFDSCDTPPMEHFARRLSELILKLKARLLENAANQLLPADFRVFLVAHSMGGLICRAFLQNPALGSSEARAAVDKVFTYATPHNGIDRRIVHRSHSGYYGIVNSEEGYQNLTRFLFGQLRMDGVLDTDDISLPIEVQKALDAGKTVRASYQFEVAVSIRACQWQITRRELRENTAIFRTYAQLFPGAEGTVRAPDRSQSPHLFSVFLDPTKSVKASGSVSLAFELRILVPD